MPISYRRLTHDPNDDAWAQTDGRTQLQLRIALAEREMSVVDRTWGSLYLLPPRETGVMMPWRVVSLPYSCEMSRLNSSGKKWSHSWVRSSRNFGCAFISHAALFLDYAKEDSVYRICSTYVRFRNCEPFRACVPNLSIESGKCLKNAQFTHSAGCCFFREIGTSGVFITYLFIKIGRVNGGTFCYFMAKPIDISICNILFQYLYSKLLIRIYLYVIFGKKPSRLARISL